MPRRKMPKKPIDKVKGSEILQIYMEAAINKDIDVGHVSDNNPVTRAIKISGDGRTIPQFRNVVRNTNLLQSEGLTDAEIEILKGFDVIISQEGQGRIAYSSIKTLYYRLSAQINSDYFFHNYVRTHSEIEHKQIDMLIQDDDPDSEDNSSSEDDSDSDDSSGVDDNDEDLSMW